MGSVLFKILIQCDECNGPVFVPGPLLDIPCRSCGSTVQLRPTDWHAMLNDGHEESTGMRPGEIRRTSWIRGYRISFAYGPSYPTCPSCQGYFDISTAPLGSDGVVACGGCGATAETHPAPQWLQAVLPIALQTYCATTEAEAEVDPGSTEVKPVKMGCLNCGAVLTIKGTTERVATCQYCDADYFVPVDIWRHLHPAKKRTAWYVWFRK